jgi:hypothetical protein
VITPAYSITATERVLPRMALDFTTGVLDPRVTVTRALNTATRINSSGLIEIVNANLPRFDYDSITLAPKGLLIEEARTNLLTYSDQFDNAAWVKSGLNTTGTPAYIDVAVSPDGTQNADFMIEDAANSQHTTRVSATMAATTTHTYSFFVKAAGRINISASRFNSAVVPSFVHTFTLTGSGSSSGGTVTALSNGWYRCSGSFTTTGAGVGGFVILLSDGTGTTYQGDGTSGVYIWGAQLEAGAFPTSYIPTTTTSLTRNADVVSMTGTNFSDWYNQAAGAFAVSFDRIAAVSTSFSGGQPRTLRVVNAAVTDFFILGGNSSFGEQLIGRASGVDTVSIQTGVQIAANTVATECFSYAVNNFALSVNGASAQTDVSGANPATMDTLHIGDGVTATRNINGHVRKISYWPQRITNAEVQAFSKG